MGLCPGAQGMEMANLHHTGVALPRCHQPPRRTGLSRETHWKGGSVLAVFSPSACQASVRGSQPSPSVPCVPHGSEGLECPFGAPKVESTLPPARRCGQRLSWCPPALPAEPKTSREEQEGLKDLLNSPVEPHGSGSPELLRLGNARG